MCGKFQGPPCEWCEFEQIFRQVAKWDNSEKILKFNLSRGHFYKKMKYLQAETTEQGPFLGKPGACQMA